MLRRNRKITITTRQTVSTSVNSTSLIESRMDCEASNADLQFHRRRNRAARTRGSNAWTSSTTSTVLVPGCRLIARIMPRTFIDPRDDLVVLDVVDHAAQLFETHRRAVPVGHDHGPVLRRARELCRSIRR